MDSTLACDRLGDNKNKRFFKKEADKIGSKNFMWNLQRIRQKKAIHPPLLQKVYKV